MSIRRACRVLEMDTSSYHYRSRRPDQAGLEARIEAICETRVRYGYRRVHVLLQREGWRIDIKKTHRIYDALGLQLRNKTPKRRVKAKLREDRCAAARPNETWAIELAASRRPSGRPRPVGDRPQDPDPDSSGHLQPLLAGDRSPVHLPVGKSGRGPGPGLRPAGLSESDPGRSGHRVRLPERLCPWRHPGLLQARQADGQRLDRVLQWPLRG